MSANLRALLEARTRTAFMSTSWPDDERYNPDNDVDTREYTECDRCDKRILDGAADNGRIGPFYLCGPCWSEQMDVLNGRARAAQSDELRDDADAMARRVEEA